MDRSVAETTRECLDESWCILRSLGAVPDGIDPVASYFEVHATDTVACVRELIRAGLRELADAYDHLPELAADRAEILRALERLEARLDPPPP